MNDARHASSTGSNASAPLVLSGVETERGRFHGGPYDHTIAPGGGLVLVGRNGCGKSTLLETIAGLLPVRSGTISREGRVWSSVGVHVAPHERGVGLLLQRLGLWPHRTIRAQIELVAPRGGARVSRLATELGLAPLLDRRPAQLSGGEAQRAALLRTIAPDPPVLLLDEPTSDQHSDGEARIAAVLTEELGRGKIVVVASHRPWPEWESVDLG